MTARIYHWTGENPNIHTSSANSLVFVESGYSGNERIEIATDVQRFGSSSFHVGYVDAADNSVNPPTYYRRRTYLNASGTIDTVGQGDFAVAFWWKPTAESFYSEGGNHKTIIHSHLGMMSSYAAHGHSLTNYDIRWYAPYGDDTPDVDQYVAKTYQINLTGMPWIHIYASRIGETLRFVLSDANGDVFVDNNGNDCDWSYTGQASKRYNINNVTNQTPYFRVGGGGSGTSNIGYYDDIVLVQSQSLSYDSLDLTRPVYISGEPITPVINSFSSSATTVESGDSVTLSWEDYYSESLQLQKHIGGVLNNTETVTGSSKSVTVTESVTYKIRGANTYASSSFSSVEITLNGGNTMAKLSGSAAIPYQLHGGFLGGFVTDVNNAFQHLPIMSGSDGSTDMDYLAGRSLNAGFAGVSGSIISALNHLYTEGDFQAGTGVDSSQLANDVIGVSASHLSFAFEGGTGKLELASNIAGTGLSLASGQLSVDAAQTQITSVGTIAAGVWNATDIGVAHGGTGASSAGDARTNLGVAIGSDVQAYDADLDNLSGMQTGASAAVALLTSTEVAILDGATVTTAELNYLDNDSLEAADFTKLAAVTSDATELNLLDGSSAGSKVASKAVIYDALKGVQGDYVSGSVAVSGALGAFGSLTFGGVALTSTATELNLLDGVSGLVQADFTKLAAVDSSAAQLNLLNNADLVAGDITKLAALDVSAAELNLLDAGAGSSVALADGDSFIMFDADDSNEAKKVVMTDILTYIAANDDERVQDIVGAMVSSNSESGIVVSYEDGDGTLDFSVSVAAANIAANAVGAAGIVTNGVGSLEIAADAVNSAKILDGSITGAQMAQMIHHVDAGDGMVFDATAPNAATGLFLKGTNAGGTSAYFQLKVDGGLIQLVDTGASAPSVSSETSANAAGTNGS